MNRDNFDVNLSILIFRDVSILHFFVVYMLNKHNHDKILSTKYNSGMKNNVNMNVVNIYYNYNDTININYWHTQDSQQP